MFTAAPLYTLLKIKNRVKTKDTYFVQDYWKRTIFLFSFIYFLIFPFSIFLDFFLFLFFWIFPFSFFYFLDFSFFYFLDFPFSIFLILNQRNFLTFHHTRVFLPSSHEDVLIFELFRRSAFLNFTMQRFFRIFTTRVLKYQILPLKSLEIVPHKGFKIIPHKGFENVSHKGFEIYITQGL